ncbi:MAG: DNA polymerase III subunit alpha [Pseudomonadota bacterium]|nr:DNA polymerase III subunit alpha [Pseudomonadota bacterium]
MARTPANTAPFVHLRVHSAYSLLEGALTVEKLASLASRQRMPAIALTDTNNLFGAFEFSEKMAAAGIQPIIGIALAVAFEAPPRHAAEAQSPREADGVIALLAKDETGYANLLQLSTMAFLESGDTDKPVVPLQAVSANSQGLIAMTGGPDGPIDRALANDAAELAKSRLEMLAGIFNDRLYVELQRHGLPQERHAEPRLIELAYAMDLPLVATNEPYFATQADFEAHDALLCIAGGAYVSEDIRRRLSPEHYFKSQSEMTALFADLPEAIASTSEIARRCAYRPQQRKPILPSTGDDDEGEGLRRQAEEGLRARLAAQGCAPGVPEEEYWTRLRTEVEIIARMNYAGYFLIVADFIKWAKAQGIPVGPGRGSGAGSLVAWALTITDLDPIRFGLLFERFLNPERVSMPDFDIDFCQDRRDEVIRYVCDKYGADRVAQIITFGKLQARAVLRDVGRVLQMPYGQVDRLCKRVPNNPASPVKLKDAIADRDTGLQEARDTDPLVERLLDIAQKLEGLYRHASTHAAGIVIADRPLRELVPLYQDPRGQLPATQYNMKWVEAAGLVKFDFLGLKTLTVIENAKHLINRGGGSIDPARLALNDAATFELLSRAETVGVFQLESTGMRDALRKLKPDRFEDIIAMVALYRPGPMANIETYINRKHGRETPDYLHPLIAPILEETYGVIIYQEQVMQIAQKLSGYSLGEADLLRRAMGKKIKAEMDQQMSRFVEGAVANGVDRAKAEIIFDLVARFAGYGFNKSHAAAYALLAYQTAYLKANHPVEFLAASMTLDMGNTDKLSIFVQEARRQDIGIQPPSVNASMADFSPEGRSIRYALAALRNMGRLAAQRLVEEREANGPFRNLDDFASRLDAASYNKRAVETLAASGAFDALEPDRAKVHGNADKIMQAASSSGEAGQEDLFAGKAVRSLNLRPTHPWPAMERLSREFEAIGFFLSGHPLDEYQPLLNGSQILDWAAFSQRVQRGAAHGTLAATVTHRQERRSAKGNRFAFVGFSDRTAQFEAVVFSDTLSEAREILEPGTPVLIDLEAEKDGEGLRARLKSVRRLEDLLNQTQAGVRVVLREAASLAALAKHLPATGEGELRLVLQLTDVDRSVELRIPDRRKPSIDEQDALRRIDGVQDVQPLLSPTRKAVNA